MVFRLAGREPTVNMHRPAVIIRRYLPSRCNLTTGLVFCPVHHNQSRASGTAALLVARLYTIREIPQLSTESGCRSYYASCGCLVRPVHAAPLTHYRALAKCDCKFQTRPYLPCPSKGSVSRVLGTGSGFVDCWQLSLAFLFGPKEVPHNVMPRS